MYSSKNYKTKNKFQKSNYLENESKFSTILSCISNYTSRNNINTSIPNLKSRQSLDESKYMRNLERRLEKENRKRQLDRECRKQMKVEKISFINYWLKDGVVE